jgi:hypothetical protein
MAETLAVDMFDIKDVDVTEVNIDGAALKITLQKAEQ